MDRHRQRVAPKYRDKMHRQIDRRGKRQTGSQADRQADNDG